MSYDHTVFVGWYAKCTIGLGERPEHWLLNDNPLPPEAEPLRGMHYVFPEFLPDGDKFAYLVLKGATVLKDVGRSDSLVQPIGDVNRRVDPTIDKALKDVFGFISIDWRFGAIVEVQ